MMKNKVRTGIIGIGHLGKIHLENAMQIGSIDLAGLYDVNDVNAKKISEEKNIKAYSSADELIEDCEAVFVITPTIFHFENAAKVLRAQKHLFVEKPVTYTIEEARELIDLAREANVKVQVGHVERFNPAFVAIKNETINPMFIETHRLAAFNPRGTDVSVILDLMIHDIDIMLHIVKSNVKKISASGVAVVSDLPDIANARIEFDNGCVANLTASRISLKKMRKTRLFQRDAYIAVDFLERSVEIFRLDELQGEAGPMDMILDAGNDKVKKISFSNPEVPQLNAIRKEQEMFIESILENKPTVVTLEDGFNALKIATEIMMKINTSMSVV